jgi:hypothetical protein
VFCRRGVSAYFTAVCLCMKRSLLGSLSPLWERERVRGNGVAANLLTQTKSAIARQRDCKGEGTYGRLAEGLVREGNRCLGLSGGSLWRR